MGRKRGRKKKRKSEMRGRGKAGEKRGQNKRSNGKEKLFGLGWRGRWHKRIEKGAKQES